MKIHLVIILALISQLHAVPSYASPKASHTIPAAAVAVGEAKAIAQAFNNRDLEKIEKLTGKTFSNWQKMNPAAPGLKFGDYVSTELKEWPDGRYGLVHKFQMLIDGNSAYQWWILYEYKNGKYYFAGLNGLGW